MAASAMADTILATHGGGGAWESALHLAAAALDALESANEELCGRILIHFLWRWTDFLGIQPHTDNCGSCGATCGAAYGKNTAAPLWFSAREGSVLCVDCLPAERGETGLLRINPGCQRWLAAVGQLEPALLYRYSMDSKSFREAKSLVCAILTEALGKRLASWEWLQ
jgi:DNA repair protein RecO (recombination protein O)